MIGGIERLRGTRAINWRTIIGLVLVPITAAGVLLWGLWSPTDRLDTVTAAVVNLDEPVEVEGQLLPLGRVLAGELIAGDADTNFTWVLTDEDDAEAGLNDGRYATVVTIPENFSEAATSMSSVAGDGGSVSDVRRATIDIETSDRGRLLDAALSNIVIETATRVLNEQLGSQFVGGIFVGMTELGKGIGEAAEGAKLLADGGNQLADGAAQLAEGTAQLSDGANGLAVGGAELASGATGLADGARQIASGSTELAGGIAGYTGLVNTVLTGVIDNSAEAIAPLEATRDIIAMIPPELWPADADMSQADTLAMLQALIDEMIAASTDSPDSGLVQLRMAGEGLASGSAALAAGQTGLADGLDEFAAGAHEFSSGLGQFASGAAQVVPGATQLADGARQAATGTSELASGLSQAANGIPEYSDEEVEQMSKVAVQPVEAEGTGGELFNASGVPLFAGIALWAGAFASFLLLAPLWRRTKEAARGVGYITLRSALPALAIGALQGAVAGIVLPLLLGYDMTQGLQFFGLALLAGVSFSLVNQGLSALFGGLGRFISFALLVVAFAIGVISTAPPLLQSIGDASPVGALFAGFQGVAMQTGGVGQAAFALVVWGVAGLALTAFAIARSRRKLED